MKKAFILLVCSFFSLLYAQNLLIMQTNEGNITLKLFPKIAPKASENFETLAKNGYYNDVIFHRIIKGFMVQGGDPSGSGRGGDSIWHKSFEDEFKPNVVFDRAGLLAMANKGPNTNTSQFFITFKPTPWLNGRHTIFGEVVDGFDVLKKLELTKTNSQDRPIEPKKIIKISISQEK